MENEINVVPDGLNERDQIRHALRIRGIRQHEVAERHGVSTTHVAYVLNGKRDSKSVLDTCRLMIKEYDDPKTA